MAKTEALLKEPITCGQTVQLMCLSCLMGFEITHEPWHRLNPERIKPATISFCPYCMVMEALKLAEPKGE